MAAKNNPDVLIVGGGLIGCSIALRLAQAGLRVHVYERGEPGCGASGAGAGMIAPDSETAEPKAFHALCARSRDLYAAFAAEMEELSGQRVEFHADGTVVAAFDDGEVAELRRVYEARKKEGLAIERLSSEEARQRVPCLSAAVREAIVIAGESRIDNEFLVATLVEACRRAGVIFHTHTTVSRFIARDGAVESIEVDGTPATACAAGMFVLAAGAWCADLAASAQMRVPVIPCRGQLIEFEGAANFSTTLRAGHHYLVPRSGGRLVAGSIMEYAGFENAVTGEGLISILKAAERIAPCVKQLRFRRAWAGFRPDTPDHLPILGYGEYRNLIFATGHFRNGILLTPITAQLISELILSGSHVEMLAPYSPGRFCYGLHG
ncbi:MAG TPA: glycine oxidase ThiO [Terriglobia bacterium]|nr:glycine oxidase ThiO [Terriglobia bacterium]